MSSDQGIDGHSGLSLSKSQRLSWSLPMRLTRSSSFACTMKMRPGRRRLRLRSTRIEQSSIKVGSIPLPVTRQINARFGSMESLSSQLFLNQATDRTFASSTIVRIVPFSPALTTTSPASRRTHLRVLPCIVVECRQVSRQPGTFWPPLQRSSGPARGLLTPVSSPRPRTLPPDTPASSSRCDRSRVAMLDLFVKTPRQPGARWG